MKHLTIKNKDMKNLTKTIALACVLFVSSVNVFASTDKGLNNAIVDNVVDAYINSTVYGETAYVNELFSNNFNQKFNGGSKQKAIQKNAYIQFLKQNKGVKYNCETSFEWVEKGKDYSLAKVSLDFGDFKRIDYVSVSMQQDGWKIDEVNSVYNK